MTVSLVNWWLSVRSNLFYAELTEHRLSLLQESNRLRHSPV